MLKFDYQFSYSSSVPPCSVLSCSIFTGMLDFLGFFFGIGSHVSQRSCETGGVTLQPGSVIMSEPVRGVGSVCSVLRFPTLLFPGWMTSGRKGCGSPCLEELRAERVGAGDSLWARGSDPSIGAKLWLKFWLSGLRIEWGDEGGVLAWRCVRSWWSRWPWTVWLCTSMCTPSSCCQTELLKSFPQCVFWTLYWLFLQLCVCAPESSLWCRSVCICLCMRVSLQALVCSRGFGLALWRFRLRSELKTMEQPATVQRCLIFRWTAL